MSLPSLEDLTTSLGKLASRAIDDLTALTRDPGNWIVDVVSGFDLDERSRVRAEQAAGNSARSDLYGVQDDLRSRFAGDYDPPSLSATESFDSMSHEQIRDAVDAMNAEPVRAGAEGWARIGTALADGLTGFQQAIEREIADGWSGVAAAAASAATENYGSASAELARAGRLVGTKIEEASLGIAQVKATMPAAPTTALLEQVFDVVVPSAGMLKNVVHGSDEARQQAIQIMKTVYTPVMQQADANVPVLPRPLDPTVRPPAPHRHAADPAAGTADTGRPDGGGTGTSPGAPTPGDPSQQRLGSEAPTGGEDDGPAGRTGPTTGGDSSATVVDEGADDPNSLVSETDPSSVWTAPATSGAADAAVGGPGPGVGSGTGTGTGTGVGVGTPHSSGGAVGGGAPAGGAGPGGYFGRPGGYFGGPGGGPGSPGGVGGVPGSRGSAVPAAGGAGGGPAAAVGRPGAAGAAGGGMMPGGARANGEDDRERKTPGYLVNVDNGNELVGRLPLVAPSVIGE